MSKKELKQIEVLKAWISKAAPKIEVNATLRLWNGDLLPLGTQVTSELVFALNSPDAVRRLIFKPRLMTVIELYVVRLREHFALTLQHWVRNLWNNREPAVKLVGWPRTRLWLFYMSMCAIAFDRAAIGLFQVVGSRRRTGPSGIPLSRATLYHKA